MISGIGLAAGYRDLRLRAAALAPSLPRAERVFGESRERVRLRLAALAAFLIFRRAAAFCFDDAILPPDVGCMAI
jgi:hypothetical protein